jgi:hypothetical protein
LFLLFSHVDLMFCHCVLLDEAMAFWENFRCVLCFISLFIVSKLGMCVCFGGWLLFLPTGRCFVAVDPHVRGDALKGDCLALSFAEFYCFSSFYYCLGCGLFV